MKILFYGDSITDMGRDREENTPAFSYGVGYPLFVAGTLYSENANEYKIVNRGISGNRVVDLYARIKQDVWNHAPDVWSILIGVNDVWHEIEHNNGVDIKRWENIYRLMIKETKERFPNMKIVICEPFVLEGPSTCGEERFAKFLEIKKYAQVAKQIAEDNGLYFLPLQERFDEAAKTQDATYYLYDGVHPAPAGAKLIADAWLELFKTEVL